MCAPSLTGMREGSELGDEHWIPAGLVIHPGAQQQKPEDQGWVPVGAGGGVPALYSQGTAHSWASTGSSGTARDLVLPGGSLGAIRAIPLPSPWPNTRPPRRVWQPREQTFSMGHALC